MHLNSYITIKWCHMSIIASLIIKNLTNCSTDFLGQENIMLIKHQHSELLVLCEGNPSVVPLTKGQLWRKFSNGFTSSLNFVISNCSWHCLVLHSSRKYDFDKKASGSSGFRLHPTINLMEQEFKLYNYQSHQQVQPVYPTESHMAAACVATYCPVVCNAKQPHIMGINKTLLSIGIIFNSQISASSNWMVSWPYDIYEYFMSHMEYKHDISPVVYGCYNKNANKYSCQKMVL